MATQPLYSFIPPAPLPEFYSLKPHQFECDSSTSTSRSSSSAQKETSQPIEIIRELKVASSATRVRNENEVDHNSTRKASITAPVPPIIPPFQMTGFTTPAVERMPPAPLAVFHICRLCGRTRSAKYHREHPIPINGVPPPPGICRRCRFPSEKDTSRHVKTVKERRSADVKLGVQCLVRDEDILTSEDMRRISPSLGNGEILAEIPIQKTKGHRSTEIEPRKVIRYRYVQGLGTESAEPSRPPTPSKAYTVKYTSAKTDVGEDATDNESDKNVPPVRQPAAGFVAQPTESIPVSPGRSSRDGAAARRHILDDTGIRKIAREEIERYRQAERRIAAHPSPYARGRVIPVERRVDVQQDFAEPTICGNQAERRSKFTSETANYMKRGQPQTSETTFSVKERYSRGAKLDHEDRDTTQHLRGVEVDISSERTNQYLENSHHRGGHDIGVIAAARSQGESSSPAPRSARHEELKSQRGAAVPQECDDGFTSEENSRALEDAYVDIEKERSVNNALRNATSYTRPLDKIGTPVKTQDYVDRGFRQDRTSKFAEDKPHSSRPHPGVSYSKAQSVAEPSSRHTERVRSEAIRTKQAHRNSDVAVTSDQEFSFRKDDRAVHQHSSNAERLEIRSPHRYQSHDTTGSLPEEAPGTKRRQKIQHDGEYADVERINEVTESPGIRRYRKDSKFVTTSEMEGVREPLPPAQVKKEGVRTASVTNLARYKSRLDHQEGKLALSPKQVQTYESPEPEPRRVVDEFEETLIRNNHQNSDCPVEQKRPNSGFVYVEKRRPRQVIDECREILVRSNPLGKFSRSSVEGQLQPKRIVDEYEDFLVRDRPLIASSPGRHGDVGRHPGNSYCEAIDHSKASSPAKDRNAAGSIPHISSRSRHGERRKSPETEYILKKRWIQPVNHHDSSKARRKGRAESDEIAVWQGRYDRTPPVRTDTTQRTLDIRRDQRSSARENEESSRVHFSSKVEISPTPPGSDASSSAFRSYHSFGRGNSRQMDGCDSSYQGQGAAFGGEQRGRTRRRGVYQDFDEVGRMSGDGRDQRRLQKIRRAGSIGDALSESPSREKYVLGGRQQGQDCHGPYGEIQRTQSMEAHSGREDPEICRPRTRKLHHRP